ncbi:MAG: hypothetical protein PVF56_23125 [Desulfobacterales bacterium]|jgi:hypothetical protein
MPRQMKQLCFGRIINISSIAARAIEYILDSPFVTGVTLDINGGAFMI